MSELVKMLLGRRYLLGRVSVSTISHPHLRGNAATLPIHFFKIILNTNLERLKIPIMFAKRYGAAAGLSNLVILKTPDDGTEWSVCWTKLNGEVWLEKGWKEFAGNYSLEYGYLVVFKYEETSVFDVVILDQSALEIDYPSYGENGDNLNQSDDQSVENLDEGPNQKAGQRSPRHHKKIIRGEKNTQRRTSSLNRPREAKAREVAEKFISNNPFFTVSIKPANVVHNGLNVPDLGVVENKEKYVILQIGKRSRDVKLFNYDKSIACSRLSAGWTKFASESELQPGDVCVFELINKQ